MDFVRVAENKNLTVYIDVDSIANEDGYITANELKEYKIPMEFSKGVTYKSSIGLAEVDCKSNAFRVRFLDNFELNGLKGKRISHGVQEPIVAPIPPNTPTEQVRDFLCSKVELLSI
ncbi:hypothetical protein G6720_03825 [Polynucleobacter paneuropaeus]|nr:hypothetical protein G6720_03825 [Polynucleobacter paneuropaeus]